MSNTTAAPEKMNNHEMIDNAIGDMDSVIRNAENLLNKIKGTLSDLADNACDKTAPTLADVLSNATQRIRSRNETLHGLLNSIADELF